MEDLVSLLNTLEPGIVIFDKSFRIHHINRVILTLFSEFSPNEIFAKTLTDLHQASSSRKIHRILDLVNTAKRQVPFTIKFLSGDQQYRYLFMKLISLLSPGMEESLCCALMYDITAFISDKTMHLLKIPVGVKNEIKLIDLKEVIYIEADNVYSRVYTNRNNYFSGLSLGILYDRLPHKYFFRIHRSYVVNLTKINKVLKDAGALHVNLQGIDRKLPVSRSKSKEFLQIFGVK